LFAVRTGSEVRGRSRRSRTEKAIERSSPEIYQPIRGVQADHRRWCVAARTNHLRRASLVPHDHGAVRGDSQDKTLGG